MAKSANNKHVEAIQTYKWDADSLISRVDIRENTHHTVAYIYASPDEANLAKLHVLRETFHTKGWLSSSDMRDGKSVLRVTGITNKDDLIDILQKGQFAQGAPEQSSAASETKPKSFKEKIKNGSLRAAGIFYSIGNAFYIASGLARKKQKAQIATGVAFAAGDVMVTIFGGKDDERQFKSLLTKLTRHLEKNGIAIPPDSAICAEISNAHESFAAKIYDFMHEHINKIKALAEVLGGVFYFKAGRDQKNLWKQRTAVIFTLGFGSSLFIKEKKSDPDELAHAGKLQKAWAFVQEKPLRVAGWSGLSNTLFTTIGAFEERKGELAKPAWLRTDHYKYDFAASGSMLFANNLYALSNKSTGGSITSDSLINDLYGLVAQVLNREPAEKREAALKATINFLGERIEIKDTRKQIETQLRNHMAHASTENPWFKARSEETHAGKPIASEPALVSEKDSSWTAYVSQPETSEISHVAGKQ